MLCVCLVQLLKDLNKLILTTRTDEEDEAMQWAVASTWRSAWITGNDGERYQCIMSAYVELTTGREQRLTFVFNDELFCIYFNIHQERPTALVFDSNN